MATDWKKWLPDIMTDLWPLRRELGNHAAEEVGRTDANKRQARFERGAVENVRDHCPPGSVLQAEGWQFQEPTPSDADWIVGLDPTDGTAGDARFRGVGVLRHSLPLSLVLTIRKNVPNPTFASVCHAAILDLRSGQVFITHESNMGYEVFTLIPGEGRKQLVSKPQYNEHAPAVAWEIARRALAPLRFLIPYGVYPEMYSDSNSSAMVMLWSLLGYCDVYLNCKLPGISGAGQRGHELGAAAVFARALGAAAYHTGVEDGQITILGSVEGAPYTFDGQTSVILGVDQRIVQHYIRLINQTLKQEVFLGDTLGSVPLGEIFVLMYDSSPGTRWSLPLVTSIGSSD